MQRSLDNSPKNESETPDCVPQESARVPQILGLVALPRRNGRIIDVHKPRRKGASYHNGRRAWMSLQLVRVREIVIAPAIVRATEIRLGSKPHAVAPKQHGVN